MIQVLIVGGDRSSMVDGMAYDLPKGILFLRFRTSGKWYMKNVGADVIMDAIGIWMDEEQSFGKWANNVGITKNMTFFTDVDL
jgi:uncharacterized membrane-anchored protein